ncbi:hypothetical protein [Mesorhizobium sp. f-mel]
MSSAPARGAGAEAQSWGSLEGFSIVGLTLHQAGDIVDVLFASP